MLENTIKGKYKENITRKKVMQKQIVIDQCDKKIIIEHYKIKNSNRAMLENIVQEQCRRN